MQDESVLSSTSLQKGGHGSALPDHSYASCTRDGEACGLCQMLKCLEPNVETTLFRQLLYRVLDQEQGTRGWQDAFMEASHTRDHLEYLDSKEEVFLWVSIQTSITENRLEEAEAQLVRLISNLISLRNANNRSVLSGLFCLANCLAAQGQIAKVEAVLDRLLTLLQDYSSFDRDDAYICSMRAARLLARTYLVQSKFWSLEGLVTRFTATAGVLHGFDSENVIRLEKMLLLVHTDGLSLDESGETLALDLLAEIEHVSKHTHSTLLLQELLRGRYEKMGKSEKMLRMLAQMERVLEKPPAENRPSDLRVYATLTLAWSYTKLEQYDKAERWLGQFTGAVDSKFDCWNLYIKVFYFLRKQGNLKDSAPFPGEETINGTSLVDTLTTRHPMFVELVRCLNE